MIRTIKVSDKGQIAIPQEVRTLLNINKGDDLIIFNLNGKILLEKAQRTEYNLKNDFKDLLKHSEQVAKELWDNKEDEIWNNL